MISAWTIYWITSLDAINGMCAIFIPVFFMVAVLHFLMTVVEGVWDSNHDQDIRIKTIYLSLLKKLYIPGFIISILLGVFIPSTNSAALIYVIPKIANSEFVKQLPPQLEKLAMKKIDDMLRG